MALYIRDLLSILHTGFLVLDFYGVLVQLSVFTHDSYRDLRKMYTRTQKREDAEGGLNTEKGKEERREREEGEGRRES